MRNICKRTESAMETGMICEGLSWSSWSSTACPPRNLTEGPRVRRGTWPQYIWTAQQLLHRPSPGISHQHIFRPGDQQVHQTATDCDLHYRPVSQLVQPPLALDYRWIFLLTVICLYKLADLCAFINCLPSKTLRLEQTKSNTRNLIETSMFFYLQTNICIELRYAQLTMTNISLFSLQLNCHKATPAKSLLTVFIQSHKAWIYISYIHTQQSYVPDIGVNTRSRA